MSRASFGRGPYYFSEMDSCSIPLNTIGREACRVAEEHGFPIVRSKDEVILILSRLMLIDTEVAEAAEAIRAKEPDMKNFAEELADAIIRITQLANGMGIDLDFAVANKMSRNKQRPFLHGKTT